MSKNQKSEVPVNMDWVMEIVMFQKSKDMENWTGKVQGINLPPSILPWLIQQGVRHTLLDKTAMTAGKTSRENRIKAFNECLENLYAGVINVPRRGYTEHELKVMEITRSVLKLGSEKQCSNKEVIKYFSELKSEQQAAISKEAERRLKQDKEFSIDGLDI